MSPGNLAQARERIGQVLRERWLLEKVLGVGGMAAVYRARHRNGARAAIKLLHGPLSEDQVVRERFLREAYLANSIDHSGVVRVLDDDADPQLGPFIVMELLEGESVLDLLDRGGTITPDRALDIGEQTLDVLALAHDRGIVHRDLKPANLFLCEGGVVKVLDFGIARLLDDSQARLTRTGVPLGTPAYMAPEQARGLGRHVDGRADLYALGATIFRVLAGRHVHVGQGAEQIALVATQRAPSLSAVAPRLPPGVCAIVDRALLFEPERRYATAADMQADIRLARAGKTPTTLRATQGVPTPPSLPRAPASSEEGDVAQLADALRAEAHKRAKRPDAFSAPKTVPPPHSSAVPRANVAPPGDEDEDDNMPTMAYQPKEAVAALAPRRSISQPKMSAPVPSPKARPPSVPVVTTPSVEPPRAPAAPTTRQEQAHLDRSAAHEAFARIPNVPVPSFTPHAGIDIARLAQTPRVAPQVTPGKEPVTMTQAGAIVLPAPVQTHFEETQYRIEQAPDPRDARGSSSRTSAAQMAAPPSVDPPPIVPLGIASQSLPPARRFAQTLAEPEQYVPPPPPRVPSAPFQSALPTVKGMAPPPQYAAASGEEPSWIAETVPLPGSQSSSAFGPSPAAGRPAPAPPSAPVAAPGQTETNYVPLIIAFSIVLGAIIGFIVWAMTR